MKIVTIDETYLCDLQREYGRENTPHTEDIITWAEAKIKYPGIDPVYHLWHWNKDGDDYRKRHIITDDEAIVYVFTVEVPE